jgi:hypothetical protein
MMTMLYYSFFFLLLSFSFDPIKTFFSPSFVRLSPFVADAARRRRHFCLFNTPHGRSTTSHTLAAFNALEPKTASPSFHFYTHHRLSLRSSLRTKDPRRREAPTQHGVGPAPGRHHRRRRDLVRRMVLLLMMTMMMMARRAGAPRGERGGCDDEGSSLSLSPARRLIGPGRPTEA